MRRNAPTPPAEPHTDATLPPPRRTSRGHPRNLWDDFFDQNPLQRMMARGLHDARADMTAPTAEPESAMMIADDGPLELPVAAPPATDVSMSPDTKQTMCLDSIEIQGLARTMYQAPPTAYRPHATGEEPLQLQRRFVQEKLSTLRTMKARLQIIPSDHFSTQLVLNHDTIGRPVWPGGGIVRLTGMETLVMEFLAASDLIASSLVCRRWSGLCRQDGLWEKFLFSPVERYPMRRLLSVPDSIPAIQVYMIFATSGLARGPLFGRALDALESPPNEVPTTATTVIPLTAVSKDHLHHFETVPVQSVHVSRVHLPRAKRIDKMFNPTSMDGGESLKAWLAKHGPLEDQVLQSFAHQLLHACVALDDAGLKHTDISTKNIVVRPTPDRAAVPLIQLDGHYCLEKVVVPSTTTTTDEQDEALFWTIMYDPRNRDAGGTHLVKNMLCGFLYCVLDMCLEGRSANLRQHSLMYCMNVDRAYLTREFRCMLEFGAYLLYTKSPLSLLLRHPYFGERTLLDGWKVDFHAAAAGDNVTYMAQINAWYGEMLPRMMACGVPRHGPVTVPVSLVGHDCLYGDVSELQLVQARYTCIAAPATATSHWMKVVAASQNLSLKRLDLSQLGLSSSTILQGLSLLPHVTELKLPKAMLREANLEHVISAFANDLLPSLTTVEEAFCAALDKMEASYQSQLDMVEFLLEQTTQAV
ncbi:Aste57867_15621 [Aphanomyces stellatus]|uniref:Aste57867_15621 protein n=1 Tax=Aphanomyces stellatus TaxID=120398 RepID=A0A485L4G9_9STRA|nr:hypothetical protein As57867_015565 [Aphanomyces stellatus]VFT92419.1 Aste57867_15621 [Aphanomyces stellatus]